MFEFSIARKYLIPKKKQLSVSLIALLSVGVISLVVWLILVFLSVTNGIERNWLNKLTLLNAPLRVIPTNEYYSSYYYQIDNFAYDSEYTHKSLGEKLTSDRVDPYREEVDIEIPSYLPTKEIDETGNQKDLVKLAAQGIINLKKKYGEVHYQDYEMTGALMKLSLMEHRTYGSKTIHQPKGFLTQVAYLSSFCDENPNIYSVIQTPRKEDLQHLLAQLPDHESLQRFLHHIKIETVTTKPSFRLPFQLLPENTPIYVKSFQQAGQISEILIENIPTQDHHYLLYQDGKVYLYEKEQRISLLSKEIPLLLQQPLTFSVIKEKNTSYDDQQVFVKGMLQKHVIRGFVPLFSVELENYTLTTQFDSPPIVPPLWLYQVQGKTKLPPGLHGHEGVILPKSMQMNHVFLGDQGTLSYGSFTGNANVEQQLPFTVVGFYDPGVLSVGPKCLLTSSDVVRMISLSSQTQNLDPYMTNGIFVWHHNYQDAKKAKEDLIMQFQKLGIQEYFTVHSYHDYDFARDLMLQFQSDKVLFSLIAMIILMVACTNIITLFLLLVNDKRKEIGILQSMGATKRSIAAIFGLCGGILGTLSSALGILAGVFTMKYLNQLATLMSKIQGHTFFQEAFFGSALPEKISTSALVLILIVTPIFSIIAGIIPAIKASRIDPSKALRLEG